MVATNDFSHIMLAQTEDAFRSAWTGANSTPFLVDVPISKEVQEAAEKIVSQVPLCTLFLNCPTLATWAVLTPLARNYDASTKDVYLHISRFVREDYSDPVSRDALKSRYQTAARKLGLPVSGPHPTELFFAPLGPARSQHGDLARAFVWAAINLGPPAIEDTPSARAWQRRAVVSRCPTLTRLKATIAFDQSAYCARRFEAWRQGDAACNEIEADLFTAYDQASRAYGCSRQDIAGPPQVYWTGDRLALEAGRSPQPQSIKTGLFPVQIESGGRRSIDPPWGETIQWVFGGTARDIPFGLSTSEVLVFDADTGALLVRVSPETDMIEVAAERLVVLSAEDFSSPSFGSALPAADPDYRVAWIPAGEKLDFTRRGHLSIVAPRETALWIDGTPIGRSGSRALLAGDGALVVKLDPAVGGSQRVIRARLGSEVKFTLIDVDREGMARIPFSRFDSGPGLDPCRSVFEVLAHGAAGDLEARVELSATAWIWPNLTVPERELTEFPMPGNFDPTRSAGLRADQDRLHVDPRADVEAPILGLRIDGDVREFTLATGAEKLRHHRVAKGDHVLVPRGSILNLGHKDRHDALLLSSSDRDADLLVLGEVVRRPFCVRSRFEINAEMLESSTGQDDRIALRRKDGRMDILARVTRVNDPSEIGVEEDEEAVTLQITPQARYDALRVRIEAVDGTFQEGEVALARFPVDAAPPPGVSASADLDTGRLSIILNKAGRSIPARISFWIRSEDHPIFEPLEDASGARIVVGLGASVSRPDQYMLAELARFLAEPVPPILEDQVADTLGAAYAQAFASVGATRMIGSVRAALAATRADGAPPLHDLTGVAPWIFEAPAHALQGLPEASGFEPLTNLVAIPSAPGLPDPEGDAPLATWLDRVNGDADLPAGLDAPALQHGFRTLRFRLKESDLRCLVGDGCLGVSARLICATWSDATDALRSFDTGGGGDERPARIATAIEHFARAAALGRAEEHVEGLAFRTGLSRAEVGRTLTMMLRAGVELFVYFRALWSHAREQYNDGQ